MEQGANVLVDISNDGWFGRSPAALQHLYLASLRAVEQGRWLLRGTNTGISAIIDARGRVTVRGGQFEENTLWGRVRLQQGATIYHKLGLWLPLAAGLLWLGIFWGTRRPSPSTPRLFPSCNSVIFVPVASPSTSVSTTFGGVFDVAASEQLDETELVMLLSGEEDNQDAILEIHPGAGGTESQDWAEMLLRMYTRWAARRHFTVEELDYLPGDEAGIKSVTLRISGPHAFGFLKSERGIHRLIRISPFDASGRRHTSIATVDVMPDVGDDIQLDIKETDLRFDTFRSSGPGGQSVNTTSSAVRVTHIPTGISAQCQNEKSQHHNKEAALCILKARLYNLELQKREAERAAQYAGKDAIAFGSQIRTYTLQPYRLVKDHRTNSECGDVEAVLDGQIDQFQHDYLLYRHEQQR